MPVLVVVVSVVVVDLLGKLLLLDRCLLFFGSWLLFQLILTFFLIACLLLKLVLANISGCILLFHWLVLLQSLALNFLLKFQALLCLDRNFLLFGLLLALLFLFGLFSIEPLLLLVPSDLCPFNLALMQSLVDAHDLDLIGKVLTSDPSSCSFLSLVGNENALVHFQLFFPLLRHINNIGIIIE